MSRHNSKTIGAAHRLTVDQFRVTQRHDTEPAFRSEYWNNHEDGTDVDVVSGQPLFSSTDKYDNAKQRGERIMTNGSNDTGEITREQGAETAVLAGGCFWGLEDLIRRQPGVLGTRVGYTGGDNDHATYRNHPGHAEAVEIVFDPKDTTFRDILAFFFQVHDPTTMNRQGNDVGSSYRSAIFPLTAKQERVAQETIADVNASGLWPGEAVTTIEQPGPFWEAEPEHQDYLLTYPNGYTCHFPRPDWVLPKRTTA